MKIIINENETYNIEFPESITLQELGSMVDRLSMIKKLSRDPILDNDFSSIDKKTRKRTRGLFSVITDKNQAIELISRYKKGDTAYAIEIYKRFGREFVASEMSNNIWKLKNRFNIKKEEVL
jgi:hypothetical protein